jgi:UDP-glucose 4-epimerase
MGTVLVTGGAGFLGTHLASSLVNAGEQVVLTYRRSYRVPQLLSDIMESKVKAVRCEVQDLPELLRVIRDYGVDSIVHAAMVAEYSGTIYTGMQTNIIGTINVMEAAAIGSVKRVTFVSSEAIRDIGTPEGFYMGFEQENVHIDSCANSHPAAKKCGEIISLLYGAAYGISVRIVRPGHSWGPYVQQIKRGDLGMIRDIVEGAAKGKAVDLPNVASDTHVRGRYIVDACRAIALVHTAPNAQHLVYSVAEEKPYTWGEIADTVKELVPESRVTFGQSGPLGDQEVVKELRITSELGFKPKYNLRSGLREYIDWYKNGQP